MKDNGLAELKLFEAERELNSGFFFCKEFHEVGEVGESCGKLCEKYAPLNGKNGRCKHSGFVYEQTDRVKNIKGVLI
jgi:hypothetical protein